ncbi:MAG: cytochrome c [Verrucomicrobia bacterium]|nr:cytochrome c [Verrucomicrobiota bacterium]
MKSDAKKSVRNDESEPKASQTAAPVFIFVVLALLLYWGALHIDQYGGGFRKEVYAPFKSVKEVAKLHPKKSGDDVFERGEKIYALACAGCHQPSGLGSPGVAPPVAGSEWVLTPGPGRALLIAYNGLTGPITVKGTEWNLAMLAMGQQLGLSDEDLAAVLTYIRGNAAWGNNASAVTVEQVKAHRPTMDSRTQPWTAEELLKIPETE